MKYLDGTAWALRPEVVLGDLGEATVDAWIRSRGYETMSNNFDGAHRVDRMYRPVRYQTKAGTTFQQEFGFHWADVKTYARRTVYPDTGINESHYNEYCKLTEYSGMGLVIYWVDPSEELIYGNWLSELQQPARILHPENGRHYIYPMNSNSATGRKVYFPLAKMRVFARLDGAEARHLRSLAHRSWDYPKERMRSLFDDPRDPGA